MIESKREQESASLERINLQTSLPAVMPRLKTSSQREPDDFFGTSKKRYPVSILPQKTLKPLKLDAKIFSPKPDHDFKVKQTDPQGTQIRIRPATPRLNLLNIKKRKNLPKKLAKIEQLPQLDEPNLPTPPDPQFDRQDGDVSSTEEERRQPVLFNNYQQRFYDIIENDEEIENDIDLNGKFLSEQLDIDQCELPLLEKIELRVDTSCHNLQAMGEILIGLDQLKLNDSIIKTFRDLGTAFKNVQILYIDRCELQETQGIQAFEQLEELYISYNDISDLFDISFLENLVVLDLEGNQIKELDQLYSLRRCNNLRYLTLRNNPVEEDISYYKKLQEWFPNLIELDGQLLPQDKAAFYKEKEQLLRAQQIKKKLTFSEATDISKSETYQRWLKMGLVTKEQAIECCQEDIEEMMAEPDEDQVLKQSIKAFTKERKAQLELQEMQAQMSRPGTSGSKSMKTVKLRNTFSEGFKKTAELTGTSFFKTSTAASSSASIHGHMTSVLHQSNDVSTLVENNDQIMAGTPCQILRKNRAASSKRSSVVASAFPNGNVKGLIEEFQVDKQNFVSGQNRDEIRDKLNNNLSQSRQKLMVVASGSYKKGPIRAGQDSLVVADSSS